MLNYFKNLWQTYKDWKIEREFYCDGCQSCGEEGCCPIEQCLLNHGCKYSEYYARNVYFDSIVLNELLTHFKNNYIEADNVISDIYDKAFKMSNEKYGN